MPMHCQQDQIFSFVLGSAFYKREDNKMVQGLRKCHVSFAADDVEKAHAGDDVMAYDVKS